MAGNEKANTAAAEGAKPKGGKKKLIIVLAVVLLIAAGGGGWFFMKKQKAGDDEAKEEAPVVAKARIFLPIDPFTVNLSGEHNRFAQVAVTFEVNNSQTVDSIKNIMPAVRSKVLRLISAKQPAELLTADGKEELALEIATETAGLIGWEPEAPPPRKRNSKAKNSAAQDEEEDEDDESADPKKKSGKPTKKAKSKSASRAKPNPISDVHFSQFIIQ